MNKLIKIGYVGCVWAVACGWSQEIKVTGTGVEVGAAASSASGSLMQQSGQTTSFVTKDGVNPPEVRMVIKPDGKVGIGTTTPSEKFTVAGNSVTTGSATVGSLVVGASPIFTVGKFESAPQSLPGNGGSLTIAHGLGGIPTFSTVALRCITTELGWAVGDEIMLSSIHAIHNSNGVTVGLNSTEFKLRQFGTMAIHRIDGNAMTYIDSTKWRVIFRAWR